MYYGNSSFPDPTESEIERLHVHGLKTMPDQVN